MSAALDGVLEKVRTFIESTFEGQYEIYDLQFKTIDKRLYLQIFLDRPEGIGIQDCEKVSRGLSTYLDEQDLIHRRYLLEVSSPGVERVFKRQVDFERHIGRLVKWTMRPDGERGREVFKARLQVFSPERITVLADEGQRDFPLEAVEQARAVLEFPRKARG